MSITDTASIIATVFAVAGALAGTYKFAYAKGVKEARRDLNYTRELEMLQHLYAPLVSQFLDVHISSCTFTRYPTFRQRLRHALADYREKRFLKSRLKHAFRALFDKGVSEPTVGVEYGKGFPTMEIEMLLKRQAHLVPPDLISLYQRMTRDVYERGGLSEDELLPCHLDFVDHVFAEHKRLDRRVRSKP
jgi:hypothetical protein